MPKIQVSEQLLYSLLGRTLDFDSLEKELVSAKAEIDEPADQDGKLKIELNDTNRPDLWTVAGLARHLKTYHNTSNQEKNPFSFFETNPIAQKKIIVDNKLQKIRPYVLGFIISGKTLDNTLLDELIQMQEKLCDNFGQKRKAIAIGIYREKLIQWPIHYVAADSNNRKFVPLDFDQEMSLQDILNEHPKGKEYAHLIQDYSDFPLLEDSQKQVLSMPPIINSAHVGSVEVGDDTLFIECTGTNLEQLMLATNILACDCSDLGFDVVRIETEYPYEICNKESQLAQYISSKDSNFSVIAPTHFQQETSTTFDDIEQIVGSRLSEQEIVSALQKMGIKTSKTETNSISIQIPPYRNDFLHSVDIIEDIIIGKGLDSLGTEYPKSYTIGRLTEIELVSRKVIQTMVGLGFQEMIYPYLGSAKDLVENIYDESEWETMKNKMVQISNPISENYEFVRSSILPNLLSTERVSAHSPYPHRICELGKIAFLSENNNLGTETKTSLAFLIADSSVGFNDINSIIAAVFYYINHNWDTEVLVDSRFIEGRSSKILLHSNQGNVVVGAFGEIHPRVLEAHNITMPCVAGEIILDNLL